MSEPREEKKSFFRRLVEGLSKTRNNIVSGIDSVFRSFSKIDEDFYEELEEILIMGDLGVHATEAILDDLREKVKEQGIREPEKCKELLIQSIREQMDVGEADYAFEDKKSVILIVGVNGVGKTTSIGKLAWLYKSRGKKVVLAAADTFRAAAAEQLTEWAQRAGVDIIAGQEGSDPGAVVYDAIHAAKARNADILLVDTAGRLHNKKNLMNELGKLNRIINTEYPEACRETFVVLDGTTGQNALAQAKQFGEIAQVTGIVLTKLDGTAKGGIAVAIQAELNVPVKYIGVGEGIDDLQRFDADAFVNALFDRQPEAEEETAPEETEEEETEETIPEETAETTQADTGAESAPEEICETMQADTGVENVPEELYGAVSDGIREAVSEDIDETSLETGETMPEEIIEAVSESAEAAADDFSSDEAQDTQIEESQTTEAEAAAVTDKPEEEPVPENTPAEPGIVPEEPEKTQESSYFNWPEEDEPKAEEKPKKSWFRRLFDA